MLNADIAIIGMAGRFPDASDLDQLRDNLRRGRESLRPITPERVAAQALDPDVRCKVMGYLDDITAFDHEFFGIVLGEAQKLSPNMRLLLEETWRAFESTGSPPARFRGTRTDVYMTQTDSVYGGLADEESATLFTGNAPEFLVGRLNREFDLRGNSVVVDTACSSGLSATLLACDALRLDRADYALVCGANLYIFPYERPNVLETASPDGRSRSYSSDANGMVSGETAVCFVLTTRARAEAEGYAIYAVIRGGALNSNGSMSSSPSAPNSIMQARVMEEAWTRAGVHPHDLGFVEGHGSATRLGDSLEIEAFRLAFLSRGAGPRPCALSSIKANIGHGKSAAALSSLTKAILSVHHGELYPAPNAGQVNPVLNKPDSPVVVSGTLQPWTDERRVAGVHSYGMSGVNVHLVIENCRSKQHLVQNGPATDATPREWFPVAVCSRRASGVTDQLRALRTWIGTNGDVPLGDIARTQSLGREPFAYRQIVFARDVAELTCAADERLETLDAPRAASDPVPRVLMVCSRDPGDAEAVRALAARLAARFPRFQRALTRDAAADASDAAFGVAVQLALHDLFGAMGIAGTLAGVGAGRLTTAALTGAITPEQAMRDADTMDVEPLSDLAARASALVDTQAADGPVVFLQLGPESAVSRAIRARVAGSASRVEVVADDAVRSVGEIAARLFVEGVAVRFDSWFEDRDTRPVRLPGYQFARTRCWLRDAPQRHTSPVAVTSLSPVSAWDRTWASAPIWERRIAEIWRELLAQDAFGRDDNLFELGGDSLLATRIVRRVNQEFGVRCAFEDVFDAPTVAALARLVRGQCRLTTLVVAIWRDVLKVPVLGEDDSFFDLGGHSLLATEILLRVRRDFDVVLSFDDVFGAPTPRTFAGVLQARLQQTMQNGEVAVVGAEAEPARAPAPLTAAAWAAELRRRETA